MKTVETFKKTVLASLGALALTQEKIQSVARDLVERGELTKDQARRFVEELIDRGKRENSELGARIGEELQRLFDRAPWVAQVDFRVLEERVEKLEEKLRAPRDG